MPPCAHLNSPNPCDSNTLATWCKELTLWKRPWCWETLKAGEGDDRGWDGWTASLTWWTWVWAPLSDWTDRTPVSSGRTLGAMLRSLLLFCCRNLDTRSVNKLPENLHMGTSRCPMSLFKRTHFFINDFQNLQFSIALLYQKHVYLLYTHPLPHARILGFPGNLSLENWPSREVRWTLHLCSCGLSHQEVVEVSITWVGRGGTLIPLRSWEWICPGAGVGGEVEEGCMSQGLRAARLWGGRGHFTHYAVV